MKYISLAQIRESLQLLAPFNALFGTTFLVLKRERAPVGKKIRFALDAANHRFLEEHYRIQIKTGTDRTMRARACKALTRVGQPLFFTTRTTTRGGFRKSMSRACERNCQGGDAFRYSTWQPGYTEIGDGMMPQSDRLSFGSLSLIITLRLMSWRGFSKWR